jgi:energy-coupling factor transporter transmembrane protein EcfT
MRRSEEIYQAMAGRGFSDSVNLYGLKKLRPRDWLVGFSLFLIGIFFLWL